MSPRIAIVGAGPAGIYAADILLTQLPDAKIDLIEKLPAPYGLVRYGVAPDHPRIRKIIDALHEVVGHPSIRLRCNVEVGADITVDELRAAYDGVIIATGADRDVPFEVPGAELPGSFGAADFVAWYDGHPDVPRDWGLDAESVALLGAGNVALDVTRILAKHATALESTDTPDPILDQLAASRVRDVHLFARRGPADVRFSALELRELGEQHHVEVIVDPAELTLDAHAERMLEQFSQRRIIVRTLTEWAQRPRSGASRRIHLHFRHRPVRVHGTDRVESVEFERTASDPLGRMVGTGEFVSYDVGAIYRAIGYVSSPSPVCRSTPNAASSRTPRGACSTTTGLRSRDCTPPAGSSAVRSGSSARRSRMRRRPSHTSSRTWRRPIPSPARRPIRSRTSTPPSTGRAGCASTRRSAAPVPSAAGSGPRSSTAAPCSATRIPKP